jgi:hypothetical protein
MKPSEKGDYQTTAALKMRMFTDIFPVTRDFSGKEK